MTSLNLQPFNPIQKLYSSDYEGEWINVELNKDRSDRRFIKPSITFNNPGGNAICLGNGKSRSVYSLKQLESSNKRKILRYYNVVYGCNGLFREWHPDFLVLTNLILAISLAAVNMGFAKVHIHKQPFNLEILILTHTFCHPQEENIFK